jgi:glycerol-3-phosphate dehydrogenase subunit B
MLRAEVTGFEADGPTIKALIAERPEGKERIEADAFVLASGKFLGGGIVKERALRERVFNLTVFMRGRACGEFFTEKALGLRVTERHALFEAGVRVDGALRPLDRDGNPAFANLFAAGAVLSGHNYIHDQTGAGVALATGARAGMNATG